MKTKIASIALLTFAVLSLSFMVLKSTINSIKEEAMIENFNGSSLNTPEIVGSTIDVPVFQKRKINVGSSIPSGSEDFSTSSFSESYSGNTRNEIEIFSTSGVMQSNSSSSSVARSSRGSAANAQPVGMVSFNQTKSSNRERLFASNRISVPQETRLALSQPFSGMGMSGPMRIEGDGANPPAEGVPVGEGVFILLILSIAYGVFQRFRPKSIF